MNLVTELNIEKSKFEACAKLLFNFQDICSYSDKKKI